MTRTVSTTEKNQPRASQIRQTDDGVQWKIDTHNTTKAARPQLCDRAKGGARFLRLRRVFSPTATTNHMLSVSVDVYSYSFLNGMVSGSQLRLFAFWYCIRNQPPRTDFASACGLFGGLRSIHSLIDWSSTSVPPCKEPKTSTARGHLLSRLRSPV
jgi:hypothetical protein